MTEAAISSPCGDSFQEVTDEHIIDAINGSSEKKSEFIAWLLREKLISQEDLSKWLKMQENTTENEVPAEKKIKSPNQNSHANLEEIRRVKYLMYETSLDEPVSPDSTETFLDLLVDPNALTPEEQLSEAEKGRPGWLMDAFEDTLDIFANNAGKDRMRDLFFERIISSDPKTITELATKYGVSHQAVSRQERELLKRLKIVISEKYRDKLILRKGKE